MNFELEVSLSAENVAYAVFVAVTAFMFVTMMWFPAVLLNVFIGLLVLAVSALVGGLAMLGAFNLMKALNK